ncbi:RcnB family protein [Nguyenibacter sp. L1]|uniref:RcnB family protein n=1 Tax=Nguyenibacter sp. L1 TaxID=3049350 RepID=UPI002B49EB6A|nr:RcnB family protein [Nguyenibacter sp. L1]WRH86920.1 RcnB family protein [Nguyenibacter sp. L1]
MLGSMYRKSIAAFLLSGIALGSSPALADHGDGRGHEDRGWHGGGWHGDRGWHGGHGPDHGGRYREWHRGDRYVGPNWRVDDWRRYRGLYAPPPGYYWVRYGGGFLLAAVATGIIANVIAESYAPPGPMGPPPPPPPPYGPAMPYGP